MFCIYLRTNSDLCHLQHKLIGVYNREEKCLQRGTDWVFKYSGLRFVCKGLTSGRVDQSAWIPSNLPTCTFKIESLTGDDLQSYELEVVHFHRPRDLWAGMSNSVSPSTIIPHCKIKMSNGPWGQTLTNVPPDCRNRWWILHSLKYSGILWSAFLLRHGQGIESQWGRDSPHLSRPALGPTQPSVQWVPGLFPWLKSGRGVTLTPHPLLVPWSWKGRAIPLLP